MKTRKTILQIPVESQVREFDAKLLLAYIAAKRGFSPVIGSRQELKSRIASFPRSIYIAKDLRSGSRHIFKIMRKLGCEIVAWDEEALTHQLPEVYYRTRLSPVSMKYVSHLFAWGKNNAELWRQYPELRIEKPIHITGNPRGDLLRPEFRSYYDKSAEDLRYAYGNFILINTNFTGVNPFTPAQSLFLPKNEPGEKLRFGRSARGMTREYAEGLRDHRQTVFEDIQRLIPALEQAFPNLVVVVRPHPSENRKTYRKIAAQCKHVRVTNEGNVIPWLLAAKAVVHNGCTTAMEAYAMSVPAVAYRATVNDYYDNGLPSIPNRLSHQCFNFEELRATLRKILAGELGADDEDERKALFDNYLAAQDGPLACERIVDVLEKMLDGKSELPKPVFGDRLKGHYKATRRNLKKRFKSYLPSAANKPFVERYLYPGVSLEEICTRLSRFQQVLGESSNLKVDQIGNHIFRISA
jgi:surface carbohydrate biosynthesis protein